MNYSSDDDESYVRNRRREQFTPAVTRNLNEALAQALSNGFPADTECDIIVTAEELKKEEDEAKAKERGAAVTSAKEGKDSMELAEEKTKETLSQIRSESRVESEQRAVSKDDKDPIDSDDEEAEYFAAPGSLKELRAQDSIGQCMKLE